MTAILVNLVNQSKDEMQNGSLCQCNVYLVVSRLGQLQLALQQPNKHPEKATENILSQNDKCHCCQNGCYNTRLMQKFHQTIKYRVAQHPSPIIPCCRTRTRITDNAGSYLAPCVLSHHLQLHMSEGRKGLCCPIIRFHQICLVFIR